MRSFAIEEPGSPVPALYATLLSGNYRHVTRPSIIPKIPPLNLYIFVLPGNGTFSFSHILLVKVAVILDIARHNGSFPISPADIQFLLLKSESNLEPNEEIFWYFSILFSMFDQCHSVV